MSFTVTSGNRWIARAALRAAGIQNVGAMALQNLQDHIDEAFRAGNRVVIDKIAALQAKAPALQAKAPEPDPEARMDVRVTTPPPVPAAIPEDTAAAARAVGDALASLLAAGGKSAGVDMATLERVVADQVAKAQITPRVIEVRTAGRTNTVAGVVHPAFDSLVKACGTVRRLNVMLVGPAGSGKTTLARQVAEALGLPFHFTGAVMSKYELIGHTTATGGVVRTPFREAFTGGGVFLWDELDASDAKAMVAFNAALDNGMCAFPDKVEKAHPDFQVIAAANTWGLGATADYVGRNRLDAATLSRFTRIAVDYDETMERELAGPEGRSWCDYVHKVRAACRKHGVKAVISPRQILQGLSLLAAGWDMDDVRNTVLFAGMDDATRAKVRP